MKQSDIRSGWIPLPAALDEIVTPVAPNALWEQIKTNIARKSLRARCCVNGVRRKFHGRWLPFLVALEGVGSEVYLSDGKIRGGEGGAARAFG